MRTGLAALLLICLVGCSPPASEPSAAIKAMRDQFEAQVLAIEANHAGDPDGLRRAAVDIATSIYGADWNVARAEAQRSLAALPEIDLSAYETAAPTPSNFDASMLKDILPFLSAGGLASMRFYDANAVGQMIAPMSVDLMRDGDTAAMLGVKFSLVPGRVWRGVFHGEDVLAVRYFRSMVIAPYAFSAEGMILPTFASLRVFDLQPATPVK